MWALPIPDSLRGGGSCSGGVWSTISIACPGMLIGDVCAVTHTDHAATLPAQSTTTRAILRTDMASLRCPWMSESGSARAGAVLEPSHSPFYLSNAQVRES